LWVSSTGPDKGRKLLAPTTVGAWLVPQATSQASSSIAKTPLKDQKDQQSKINNQRSISKKTASLQKQHR
jgi:hypothetical protein